VQHGERGAECAPQREAVLAREHYPEHYKEFVRRYFLTLSQGARTAAQAPASSGAPP
jgi:hypothetical protein